MKFFKIATTTILAANAFVAAAYDVPEDNVIAGSADKYNAEMNAVLLKNVLQPLLRGAHITFEEQAAEASSNPTACEDPNCEGTANEGEKCSSYIPKYCKSGLYCIVANTCTNIYSSGGAFCCPDGHQPNNSNQCIQTSDPACHFGPPSPPTTNPPSSPATPSPTQGPVPAGSWLNGCPDGPWSGISHDGGDAYAFSKTPESGDWGCRPVNKPPQQILQSNLDKFKLGGESQSIMIGDAMTKVQKTFGHSLDTEKQGCGECWIIRPVAPKGQCLSFGTCTLNNLERPPVILMMSVSDEKKAYAGHLPEISNAAFKSGLTAFNNDGCNDLIDGKWSFEYQAYENADLGCISH